MSECVCACESDRQGLMMVSRSWACDLSVLFAQFHRPIALTLPMSVNIDTMGEGGNPWTISRMSVNITDAGMI